MFLVHCPDEELYHGLPARALFQRKKSSYSWRAASRANTARSSYCLNENAPGATDKVTALIVVLCIFTMQNQSVLHVCSIINIEQVFKETE